MKDAEDVPAEYLVVDSGAFIRHAPLQDLGAKIYTVPEVISELKCARTKHLIESVPYEIILQEPSLESTRTISDVSKKTGDYAALSLIDIKVLALTHDLHVEMCGSQHLNYTPDTVRTKVPDSTVTATEEGERDATEDAGEVMKHLETSCNSVAGFYKPQKATGAKECDEQNWNAEDGDDESSSDDDEGWLDETNLAEALHHLGAVVVPDRNVKVACLTTDFAMQNVMLHMGLCLLSLDGLRIRRLNSYIMRCRSCYATTKEMTRRFCQRCGNDSLHRVAVTVADDGSLQMHINWNRLKSKRGLKYSLPAPKGGKHAAVIQLFEDQRMPQNRLAKVHENPLSTDPFIMNDVTSRSAVLGIRSMQRPHSRNPNVARGGKKRGGKKR